jgi:hypothetical protein
MTMRAGKVLLLEGFSVLESHGLFKCLSGIKKNSGFGSLILGWGSLGTHLSEFYLLREAFTK